MGFRDRVLGCAARPRDGPRRRPCRSPAVAHQPDASEVERSAASPRPLAEREEEQRQEQQVQQHEQEELRSESNPDLVAGPAAEPGAAAEVDGPTADSQEVADPAAELGAAVVQPVCVATSRRGEPSPEAATAEDSPQVRALLQLLEPGQPLAGLSDFAKEYADAAFCRRLLRKFHGDVRKCRPKFIEALQWREKNEELLTKRKFVQAGDLRVIGHDASGHPMLYLCMKNQWLPNTQGMDQLTVRTVQAIEAMPPGVEKATHIWDLHGMLMRLNWNPTPMMHMLQAMEGYFAERCHQVIIIDMPGVANAIKDAVWPLVPGKTKEKILFLTPKAAEEHMRRVCDEETASRIIATMARDRDSSLTLEDRKKTWTQVNKLGELHPAFP